MAPALLFSHVARGAMGKGKRVCVLVHRRELLHQASRKLAEFAAPHGLIAPNYPMTSDLVQVASVQTLVRRLGRVPPVDLLVIDEAHHSVAGSWRAVLEAMPEAKVLGVTATPERLNARACAASSRSWCSARGSIG